MERQKYDSPKPYNNKRFLHLRLFPLRTRLQPYLHKHFLQNQLFREQLFPGSFHNGFPSTQIPGFIRRTIYGSYCLRQRWANLAMSLSSLKPAQRSLTHRNQRNFSPSDSVRIWLWKLLGTFSEPSKRLTVLNFSGRTAACFFKILSANW